MSLKMSEQKKSRGNFPRHRWNTINQNPVTHKDSLDMEVDMKVDMEDMEMDMEVMDMDMEVMV